MPRRYRIFLIIGVITLALDQITKWWARTSLPGTGRAVEVIANYWDWRLSFNKGSAFSMFAGTAGSRWFLSAIGVAAAVAIFWLVRRAKNEQTWLASALALIGGGAIGNVIDRIVYGQVTDFWVLKGDVFKIFSKTREWPAFNIADIALVAGVIIMFVFVGREEKRLKATEGASGDAKAGPKDDAKSAGAAT